MKYIKTLENIQTGPKKDDYIILNKYEPTGSFKTDDILYIWQYFLKNTIGKVEKIYHTMTYDKQIVINYKAKDVPKELQNTYLDEIKLVNTNGQRYSVFQRVFDYNNIEKYFSYSNNIDDLKIFVDQNKYNL